MTENAVVLEPVAAESSPPARKKEGEEEAVPQAVAAAASGASAHRSSCSLRWRVAALLAVTLVVLTGGVALSVCVCVLVLVLLFEGVRHSD